jgi:hypothetical protein
LQIPGFVVIFEYSICNPKENRYAYQNKPSVRQFIFISCDTSNGALTTKARFAPLIFPSKIIPVILASYPL